MRHEIINRLTTKRPSPDVVQQGVATELPASRPDQRAFVGVWPMPRGGYRIWRFEVPSVALTEDRYLASEEILDGVGYNMASIDEIEQKLAELNIESDLLDVPWASDYPL